VRRATAQTAVFFEKSDVRHEAPRPPPPQSQPQNQEALFSMLGLEQQSGLDLQHAAAPQRQCAPVERRPLLLCSSDVDP
jgi:hypothetical protein